MRFPVLFVFALSFAGCGDAGSDPRDVTPDCDYDGEACVRHTLAGAREGTCRDYQGSIACCPGCWDAAQGFCHQGVTAPMCGLYGEDCASSNCP